MKTINELPTTIDLDDIEDGRYKETPKTDADIALEDFLDKARAVGAGAKLTVKKLSNGVNSSEIFCSSYPVDKYDYFELLEVMQRNWGAGDYRIYCTVKGRKGILQNQLVSIAGMPQTQQLTHSTNENDVMSSMLRVIQENNDRLLEALKPKEDSGDRMKFMQEMMLMKQLFSGEQQKQPSMLAGMKEMIEVMTLMRGLSGESAPEAEPIWMKALSAFAPVATAAVSAMATPRMPKMSRPMPPPAPPHIHSQPMPEMRTVNPEPKAPTETKVQEPNTMPSQAENVKKLCDALDGPMSSMVEADKIAETIVENTPEENLDALAAWVSSETLIAELIALDKRVEKHKDWFVDLVEHVKAQLGLESKYSDMYDDGTDEPTDAVKDEAQPT